MPELNLTKLGGHFAQLEARLEELGTQADRAQLLEAVLDAFDNTVVVSDPSQPDNPIIYVNKNFQAITGYSFEEAVGQNCRFLQGDDHDQSGVRQLRADIEAGRSSHVVIRNYRKDGAMFWNELYLSPIKNRRGEVVLFAGVQNDITERKTLEEKTQRLAAALEQVNEAVLITGPEFEEPGPHVLYVNPVFSDMTGYTSSEIEGRSPRLLQGEKTSRVVLERLRRAVERGEPFSGEAINYRKDGGEYVVEWNIAPVFNQEGTLTHWVSAQRDVTERRDLERRLLQAAQDGRRQLATDLHDTVQQHLIATQMFLKGTAKAAGRAGAARIEAQLEEVDAMLKEAVQQVRGLSRGLEAVQQDEGGLMFALQELTRTTDRLEGVSCAFEYERPVLIGDGERAEHLYRITQEAVGNALKHARASHLIISLAEHPEGHVLRVRDNGQGFPEDVLARQQLRTIRYRADVLGATLSLSNAPTGGAVVEVTF